MANVRLQNINKVYPNGFQAVKDLSLDLADGEFVVLVGPSGCGKSTALRMIAGLEEISTGELFVGDRLMNDVEPKDRDIAMVFQNYALYPQMTVAENIGFPLRLKRIKKEPRANQVDDAARILELIDQLQSKPGQLSGGQRQRVAMGRAIVRRPSVFLMDEPLSNLDAKLRVQMRAEISSIQRDLGVTTVYVTHDQIEAMTMGDRVVVMKDGVLQQIDQPEVLYANPVNVFVAAFIGSPSMNLFHANLTTEGSGHALRFADQVVPLDPTVFAARPALHSYVGSEIVVGVRPEDLTEGPIPELSASSQSLGAGGNQDGQNVQPILKVVIETREALGAETLMHFRVAAQRVNSGDPDALDELGGNQSTRITARFSPGSKVRVGDAVGIRVNTAALHFFDRQTHLAI